MNVLRSRWAIIAVFVLLAMALIVPAVYLLAQGDGNAEILVIPPSPEPAAELPEEDQALSPSPVPQFLVYVNGAVETPGVYPLFSGARVADAVDAAGGATPEADLTGINLALRVVDEGYYYIPRQGETPPSVASPVSQPAADEQAGIAEMSGSGRALINLNTASPQELLALPGIGQVRALAIADHRAQNGPFATVEDVTKVHGIGSGIYEQVRNLVTVDGS